MPSSPQIGDTTPVLFGTSNLAWMTLLSFHMTLRYLAYCSLPLSILRSDIICVCPYSQLRNHAPLMTHDLACAAMPQCPLVVHHSSQNGLYWFEPNSSLQLFNSMLPGPPLPVNILCMPHQRLFDVLWARILLSDHFVVSRSQDLPAWDSNSQIFHFTKYCTWSILLSLLCPFFVFSLPLSSSAAHL